MKSLKCKMQNAKLAISHQPLAKKFKSSKVQKFKRAFLKPSSHQTIKPSNLPSSHPAIKPSLWAKSQGLIARNNHLTKYKSLISNPLTNNRGIMSLVEIIIIVIVLGVLVAASVVNYTGAKDRAQIRKSCSTLNTIRQSLYNFRTDNDYYPGGITDFSSMYSELSGSGLDVEPKQGVDFGGFVDYQISSGGQSYTLVVQASDSKKTLLTANPKVVLANNGSEDFSDVCSK